MTILATTGVVSLLAGVTAGDGRRATLIAALGVALGGNAGLLSLPRFVVPPVQRTIGAERSGPVPWALAAVLTMAFVVVLGPGVSL